MLVYVVLTDTFFTVAEDIAFFLFLEMHLYIGVCTYKAASEFRYRIGAGVSFLFLTKICSVTVTPLLDPDVVRPGTRYFDIGAQVISGRSWSLDWDWQRGQDADGTIWSCANYSPGGR